MKQHFCFHDGTKAEHECTHTHEFFEFKQPDSDPYGFFPTDDPDP